MVRVVKVSWSPSERRSLLPSLPRKDAGLVVLGFIQARTTSTRLPNKIYKDLNGAPLLYHTIARAKEAHLLDDVVIVSPHPLPDVPEDVHEFVYGGEEADVLGRFAAALEEFPCDYVVRLTSDCPLLDPHLIDAVIAHGIAASADYSANVIRLTFPDGVDCELISSKLIKLLDSTLQAPYHREHVSTAIRDNDNIQDQFKVVSIESEVDWSRIKLSVDTEEDLQRLRAMESNLGK